MKRIKAYFYDICHKLRMKRLERYRQHIYNYEINGVLNRKISDPYYGYPISDIKVGILSPVLIVTKMIEKYFGFQGYYMLRIHGIDVDTQGENEVVVAIKLARPGILIGRGGKDIEAIEDMLMKYFNKRTRISLTEVKKDVNMPYCDF